MHVVVVGGGIFGQVIAWRLALRGARVTVVEPIGPGSAGSGSGDRSRIVRAMYEEPHFAESGFHGLRLWDEWSAQLGVRCVEKVGVVYLVRREGEGAAGFRDAIAKGVEHVRGLGGEVEEMSPAECARRWPAMATSDLEGAVLEVGAGYGRAALATRAIARAGIATGRVTHVAGRAAEVLEKAGRATGIRWEPMDSASGHEERAVGIRLDPKGSSSGARLAGGGAGGVIEADAVVVASGFAGVALVAPICGRLPIERIAHWTSYWDVPYPEGAGLHQSVLPAWADLGAELYGFPDDGESGFKAASHAPRPRQPARGGDQGGGGARDQEERGAGDEGSTQENSIEAMGKRGTGEAEGPSEAEIEALRERIAVRFPAIVKGACRGTYACAYDSTVDEGFQIGPVPGVEGLWFVGGLSGHGFKHAPGIGESVAASVLGEAPLLDLGVYTLKGRG